MSEEYVIDLRQFTNVLNPVYAPYLHNKHRYLVLYGGAGSGKSHFACQKIIYRALSEEGHRFLVLRKVARTLRQSVFQLFLDYLSEWNISHLFNINKSDMTITFQSNGSTILFAGIDDPEKLKSIERITGLWIEEASELLPKDFEEADRRLRGVKHSYMQIILSFNPILKSNWLYKKFFRDAKPDDEDVAVLRTTYKDNIKNKDDVAYHKLLEGYTGNSRRVYTLGEWGTLEHAIYQNWKMIPDSQFPKVPKTDLDYSLDFGYINPNALVQMLVDLELRKVYIHELIYKRRQTTPDLVAEMKELGLIHSVIVADSEAPDKIEELKREGFIYVRPSKKGAGSVNSGIDYVQQFELLITDSSVNVKKEIESYQRKVDKDGEVLETPEKGLDHAMDAIRNLLFTIYYRSGARMGEVI